MQGGHDGSSRGMPDDALGFDDWSQCGHHAMPGRYAGISAPLPLPARERYGGAWGKGGDGWMDGGRHFGPKLLDEQPRGADDQLLFGPLSTTSCLSLGRYGH